MSIDFTRPTLLRTIIYFLLLYVVFRGREFFFPADIQSADEWMMPLGKWLTGFFERHTTWREITIFLLTFVNGLYITRIVSRNLIYLERTYLPVLIYPLVALGYAVTPATPVMLPVAFLLIFAVDNMIKSHKREENFGYFLHASVALGLAPLLYAPSIVLLLLLPVGFILFRQNWRSVLTAILGYLLPVFFCSYVLWGMGNDFTDTVRQIGTIITAPSEETRFISRMNVWDYALSGIFLILTLTALVSFSRRQTTVRRRALRGNAIFTWTLVIVVGMIALPCRSLDILPVLAVPLAAVVPACFNRKSGWMTNLLYTVMILSVLAYNLIVYLPLLNL